MTKLATLIALALLAACQSSSPPPEVEDLGPIRIENAALGLAIADLPSIFALSTNSGDSLELQRTGEEIEGALWIELETVTDDSVNLVEIVNGQRKIYEALPGGSFSGSRELMLPDGRPGYYSRGRFLEADTEVEEFRIFALHPLENRLLTVFYRFPAGTDSADRLNDLLLLVGEIEGLETSSDVSASGEGP